MKKFNGLFILLLLILAISCEQESVIPASPDDYSVNQDEPGDGTLSFRGGNKVDICHNGKIISVNINAVPAHQAHGDAVDMDGDGYFDMVSDCGTGEADCDDNDPDVNVTVCGVTTYQFDNLSPGNLDGQDGWTARGWVNNTPQPAFITEVATVENGTLGLTANSAGSGWGTSGSKFLDIPEINACDDAAYFEFEAKINTFGVMFGPGYDENNDGVIGIFREASQETPVYFWLSAAAAPTWGVKVVPSGGYYAATTVPVSAVGGQGDHVKIKVVINFQTNGGAGSADCYYQNITNGDTSYQPIAGLTGVALELDFDATDSRNPSLWNGIAYHFEGRDGEIDNFVFANCQ